MAPPEQVTHTAAGTTQSGHHQNQCPLSPPPTTREAGVWVSVPMSVAHSSGSVPSPGWSGKSVPQVWMSLDGGDQQQAGAAGRYQRGSNAGPLVPLAHNRKELIAGYVTNWVHL
jgi:hypothetical protein